MKTQNPLHDAVTKAFEKLEKENQLLKFEAEKMGKLILRFIVAPDFVTEVMESIKEETENSPENFLSSDGEDVEITDSDVDRHIEKVFEFRYNTEDVPTVVYEYFYEHSNKDELTSWEDDIRELFKEHRVAERDPLGYVGMSQKNFL